MLRRRDWDRGTRGRIVARPVRRAAWPIPRWHAGGAAVRPPERRAPRTAVVPGVARPRPQWVVRRGTGGSDTYHRGRGRPVAPHGGLVRGLREDLVERGVGGRIA